MIGIDTCSSFIRQGTYTVRAALSILAATSICSLTSCESGSTASPDETPGNIAQLECDHRQHELPVVTHWSSDTGEFEYLASGNLIEELSYNAESSYQTGCHARWTLDGPTPYFPQYQRYLGSQFALQSIRDADVYEWSAEVCQTSDQAIKVLRPDAWREGSVDRSRIAENASFVQMIHGVVIADAAGKPSSLATVVLPRYWSSTPDKPYPIVTMGYYDLNLTTFRVPQGKSVVDIVAKSTQENRTGAIGIIFNGNAGKVGYTNNEQAFRDFAEIINSVATDLGADQHRIVAFGSSRGGSSAINFAANPYDLNYTVLYAAAGAAAAHAQRLMELAPSFTYPRTAEVVSEVIGFHDAWRPDWQYPDCGAQQYRGLDAQQVLADVIYGAEPDAIDAVTPFADENVQRLLERETKIYLSIGRNDVLPPAAQLDFANKLLRLGVDAEVSSVSRGGHGGLRDSDERAMQALWSIMADQPISVDRGLHHFVADHNSGEYAALSISDGEFPFVMEAPRVAVRGLPTSWVFSGTPDTEFRAQVLPPVGSELPPIEISGVIPNEQDDIFFIESLTIPTSYPSGEFNYTLEIKPPGQTWWAIDSRNTPAPGAVAVAASVLVPEEIPDISGAALSEFIEKQIPEHPMTIGGTAWGISEY